MRLALAWILAMPMRASPLYTHKSGHDDATMTFVLRSVSLSVALSVLAAACALVEPPVPANTQAVANLADDSRSCSRARFAT